MSVYKISITKNQLEAIPENERAFFLQSTVMINEINILFKTIYLNKAADQNEIEKKGLYLQKLFFHQILIGKLWESYQSLRKFFYNGVSKTYRPIFSSDLEAVRIEIEKFFESSWMKDIRDKISFHYDKNIILEGYNNLQDDEAIDFYLCEEGQGNSLYYTALSIRYERILNHIMNKKGIKKGHYKEAVESLFGETEAITKTFIRFLEGCIQTFFVHNKIQPVPQKVTEITPLYSSSVNIPFFIKRGQQK